MSISSDLRDLLHVFSLSACYSRPRRVSVRVRRHSHYALYSFLLDALSSSSSSSSSVKLAILLFSVSDLFFKQTKKGIEALITALV